MEMVRVGIIGLGNMGSFYADRLANGNVEQAVLAAVCDTDTSRTDRWREYAAVVADVDTMCSSGQVDAVIIATPHYAHTTLGITALRSGRHVLVDKPISVHKADALALLAAHTDDRQVFAAMFNQRTDEYYVKIKELITQGALGEIRRVNWIITNWFRSEAYFASSGWRATWAGEGGGVLLNQCPHQLDMLCWLVGIPDRVNAQCHFGKYHDIEVEDEVTARFEYANGCSGVFITSTGEAPGTNRLEIVGELGKVVYEQDRITVHTNRVPMTEFSRTTTELFAAPEVAVEEITGLSHGGQHLAVLQNFVDAIRSGVPLIAPAKEGLASVELANAMLLSAFENRTVSLPINEHDFVKHLKLRIEQSGIKKQIRKTSATDMMGSFK